MELLHCALLLVVWRLKHTNLELMYINRSALSSITYIFILVAWILGLGSNWNWALKIARVNVDGHQARFMFI